MRRAVRFYYWNVPPDMEIAAVMHQDDCSWARRRRLVAGASLVMTDGRWEIFDSEAEARHMAKLFRMEKGTEWRITDWPICCRR